MGITVFKVLNFPSLVIHRSLPPYSMYPVIYNETLTKGTGTPVQPAALPVGLENLQGAPQHLVRCQWSLLPDGLKTGNTQAKVPS